MVLLNSQGDYITGPAIPLSTRKGTDIPNEQLSPLLQVKLQAAQDMHLKAHPDARARSLSSLYNCMGMVFASRRTCIQPEHLRMILEDDGLRRVSNKGDLQHGDIVVYRDDEGEVSHVGIVADVKADLANATWEVLVLSQWGRHGEYFHLDEDVHSRLGKPTEYWTDRV